MPVSMLLMVALVAALLLAASCGPIRAVTSTAQAQDAVLRAELAGAHELNKGEKYITQAQFEYQLAALYLEKSKELQGFAKFDAADFYASRASELGTSSVKNKAEEERRRIRRAQIKAGKIFTQTQP